MHPKTILKIEEIPNSRIDKILELTREILDQEDWTRSLEHIQIINFFREPSTRTRISFESAMKRLGGEVITISGSESSLEKNETLSDTLKSLACYGDAIVLRNSEGLISSDCDVGVPIINAGDAGFYHPTQAMIDLFTITEHFPRLDRLKCIVMGDGRSRAMHDFVAIALKYGIKVAWYGPKDIELPLHYRSVKDADVERYEKIPNEAREIADRPALEEALKETDIVWHVRFQGERKNVSYNPPYYGGVHKPYEYTTKDNYDRKCGFDETLLKLLHQNAIILHPLPRGHEMPTKIDKDRRACYFSQAQNALYVRAAILREMFE